MLREDRHGPHGQWDRIGSRVSLLGRTNQDYVGQADDLRRPQKIARVVHLQRLFTSRVDFSQRLNFDITTCNILNMYFSPGVLARLSLARTPFRPHTPTNIHTVASVRSQSAAFPNRASHFLCVIMSLQAPPGHSAQPAALIAAQLAGLTLNISPPDADLKVGLPPSYCRHTRAAG